MTSKTISLDDLDLRKAHAAPFEMEYVHPDGTPSGVVILVLGSQSEPVQDGLAKLLNDKRRKEAQAAANRRGNTPEFTPVEEDKEFGERSAAVRICGWRGITQEYTPELALKLCKSNPELARQVIEAADNAANFTKPSSRK